jgi:hypothetical protein
MHSNRVSPYRQHARILTASLVGTAVEFYDFYIYATAAALVIGPCSSRRRRLRRKCCSRS